MKASVIKIDPVNPDKRLIASAAKVIREGGLVVFPTETVYGIAANLLDDSAVARLHRVKARPAGKPFTVHISDKSMIKDMNCPIPETAEKLMNRFWPGPVTIILASGSGAKIGFRMPANKIALELIRSSGVPIVAPSANLSGVNPPVTARQALMDLADKVDMVIDGGRTDVGVESTVIDVTTDPPAILRVGAISEEELLKAING
ncbi:MAG: L-threonylcarbamoyladenylate synthase [Candidatus Omnitrophota bacterium]|nr:L-threonylcarbamoyladenylate synthase [Candidatus Omnitrophota bacterium]